MKEFSCRLILASCETAKGIEMLEVGKLILGAGEGVRSAKRELSYSFAFII